MARRRRYDDPAEDANDIVVYLCLNPWIRKRCYVVEYGGLKWEIDEFLDGNEGLIIAEVELESEDQKFSTPPWIGAEVTNDARFYNANLVAHPFSE